MNKEKLNLVFVGKSLPILKALTSMPSVRILFVLWEGKKPPVSEAGEWGNSSGGVVCGSSKEIKRELRERAKVLAGETDLMVVAETGAIIPKKVINAFRGRIVNVHKALLPKYRGRHAVNWALVKGENKIGVTVHHLTEKVDAGPIILQEELPVGKEDTVESLRPKLDELAVRLVEKTVELLLEKGELHGIEQDENEATYFPPRTPEDGLIDWSKSAEEIHNLVRASGYDYPAFTYFRGNKIKVLECRVINGDFKSRLSGSPGEKKESPRPGTVLGGDESGVVVASGRGAVLIKRWEAEGVRHKPLPGKLKGGNVGGGKGGEGNESNEGKNDSEKAFFLAPGDVLG